MASLANCLCSYFISVNCLFPFPNSFSYFFYTGNGIDFDVTAQFERDGYGNQRTSSQSRVVVSAFQRLSVPLREMDTMI